MKALITYCEHFKCMHCHYLVSNDTFLSGVNNRNHCPYCLWSRHLDLRQAGDRLAACKSEMRPVGLALKQARKRYQPALQGELMLIHLCVACGKVSLNRIAADDIPEAVLEVFEGSLCLDWRTRLQFSEQGIMPLGEGDSSLVRQRLYGVGVAN